MKSKAMKTTAKAMTKAQLADQLATKSELKKKDWGLGHARIRFWSFLVLSHAGDHKSILILPAGCDVGAARALRNWCKRSLKDRQASRRLRRSFTLRADPHKQYSMKQHVGKVG